MSRKLKLGSVSLGQLISDLKDTSWFYTDEIIPYQLWVTNLNESVNELFELSGWRKLSEYRDYVQIPIIKSVYSNAISGSSYDADLFILTIPAEADWENATGFDENWLGESGRTGARGQMTDLSTGTSYQITITEVIDSTSVAIVPTGTPPDIADVNLVVTLDTTVNNEADNIDLTLLPNYKSLDKLEKITSTAVRDNLCLFGEDSMGNMKVTSKDFEVMKNSYNFRFQIMGYRNGEIIRMAKGSELTTYGTRILYFTTFPTAMVNDTDLIDVRDVDVPKVKKYTLIKTLGNLPKDRFKTAIPEVDLDWFQTLQGSKQAVMEKKPAME